MTPTPLTRDTIMDFQVRLEKISASQKPVFGSLMPSDLMVHLAIALDTASGRAPELKAGNFFTRTRIMKWFIIDGPAWPKGKIKAPDSLTPRTDKPLLKTRVELFAAMDRFIAFLEDPSTKPAPHPFLGNISKAQWSRFQGKHLDHHLQQYEV